MTHIKLKWNSETEFVSFTPFPGLKLQLKIWKFFYKTKYDRSRFALIFPLNDRLKIFIWDLDWDDLNLWGAAKKKKLNWHFHWNNEIIKLIYLDQNIKNGFTWLIDRLKVYSTSKIEVIIRFVSFRKRIISLHTICNIFINNTQLFIFKKRQPMFYFKNDE